MCDSDSGHEDSEPDLPTFEGENDDWRIFITEFRDIASYEGWGKSDRLYYLRTCLVGEAEFFVKGLAKEDRRDYKRLVKILKWKFEVNEHNLEWRRNRMEEIREDHQLRIKKMNECFITQYDTENREAAKRVQTFSSTQKDEEYTALALHEDTNYTFQVATENKVHSGQFVELV